MLYQNPIPHRETQQPDLCGAAMIATDCKWRGTDYGGTLENLAVNLGLHINERNKDMYGLKLRERALPNGHVDIGITIDSLKNPCLLRKISKTLEGLKIEVIPLSQITGRDERFYDPNLALEPIREFIKNCFEERKGLGINYRLEPFTGREAGHYATIIALDDKEKMLYVCDSSPFAPEYWKAPLEKFTRGMQSIWKEDDGKIRERGFVTFDGTMKKEKWSETEIKKLLSNVPEFKPANFRVRKYPSHPDKNRQKPYVSRNNQ